MVQTMSHIVNEFPASKLHDGGLQRLHSTDDVAINWLEGIALKHTTHTHTHTHTFNGPFSGTTRVSRYQKGETNLDFTEARDSEWQWHQLGHMPASRSKQITMPVPHHSSFLQARCPSCRPTNSVKALKA